MEQATGEERGPVNPSTQGRVALAVSALVVAAGVFAPQGATWGIHALGRFPLPVALAGLGAILIAFLPLPGRLPEPTAAKRLAVAALVPVFGLVAWAGRLGTQLLGDGQLIVRTFDLAAQGSTDVVVHSARSILAHDHVSPLASLLHLAFVRAGSGGAESALALESILLGVVLAAAIAVWLGRSAVPVPGAWVAVLALTSPTVLLYFGYVENYTAAHLALGLYVALAFLAMAGRIRPVGAVLVLLVATCLHVQAVVWWPSALFLLGLRKWPRWTARLPRWVLFGSFVVAAVAALVFPGRGLLPHFDGQGGMSLWSLGHLTDVLQTLWLIFPWIPLTLWLRWHGRSRAGEFDARVSFADLLVGPGVVYLFFVDPVLGAARDWDRSAFLSWAFLAMTVASLVVGIARGRFSMRDARGWILPVAVLGVVYTTAWVALHHSPERSLARIGEVVRADPHAAAHGFEALARYHGDRREWGEAGEQARSAFEASGNPRLATLASQHLRRAGRLDEARELLERAIVRHPDDHRVRHELVRLVAGEGDCDRALELALEGARLHPGEPIYPFFAGDCLVRLGRTEQARPWLVRLLAMDGIPASSREHAERLLRRIDAQ